MITRAVATAAAALVLAGSTSAGSTSAGAAAPRRHLAVVGFQEESSALRLIDRSAAALTTVGVDGVNLVASGSSVTPVSAAARRQLARAHRLHLRAELLVGNFLGDDFDEAVAHRLLASPANVERVARHLARVARRQHWDGLCIDLESLTARDRAGLTAFLRALRRHLPHRSLTIAVQNNPTAAAYRANGYDLRAIGRIVDRVELMAYDQHGPWEDTPGPVGSLRWQRTGLHALLRLVPRRKVDLGVAGYGYAWRPHSNDMLSDRQARRLAGRHARWVSRVGEWTATLPDGSTLWWSDARSYRLRAELASTERLHGLAVWSLRLSDRLRP
jgi:spore germination protein YaaH